MINPNRKKLFIKLFLGLVAFSIYLYLMFTVGYVHSSQDEAVVTDYHYTRLTSSWKVMKGDNPEYKNPALDDLHWQTFKVTSNMQQDLAIGFDEIVWYRKWLYLPEDKPAFPLGVKLGKLAYNGEVFINGLLVGSTNLANRNDLLGENLQLYQIPSQFIRFGDYNLVAIRVKGSDLDISGIITDQVILGDYKLLWTELIRVEAVILIFSGSFIILGLSVLFFFIRRPKEQEYLFLGLGSLDMGIYTFYTSQWRYILGIEKVCDARIYYLSVFFVMPIFLRFTYELLPKSSPLTKIEENFNALTKGLLWYAGILVISLLLYHDLHAWEFVDSYINDGVIITSSCLGIIYLFTKLLLKDKDTFIMFCGCMIAISSGMLEIARQYYSIIPQYIATWGLAIFIFSQAIVVTNRFLRLHKKVEQHSQTLEHMVNTRTKQLQSMEESRRRLIANISHDLRTPVTSVLGHVELLLEDIVESPHQQRIYLKRIHSKMIGLHRLIQDLFDLIKLESCQASFRMTKLSANSFMTDIYLNYVSDVKNAGFLLEYKKPIISEVFIQADPDRLDQVFANLISNATRHMVVGELITLSYELITTEDRIKNMQGEVLFKVADNGVGIAAEHIPYIFERFYRGSSSRETVSQNSGLGLAIAKEIVEAHGGRIWIDTQVVSGCTICVSLPITT